jgi:hypothetical protein
MPAMKTISRRTFLSTGASLLATGASLMMWPQVYGADSSEATRVPGPGSEAAVPSLVQGGHHTEDAMDKCIQLCHDCHALCTRTLKHCLELGGRHAGAEHIRLLVDCAQLCQMNIDYMLRGSLLHERVCGLCGEACKLCADNCAQLAGDDQMLKQCADMCRRCADSCERMASKVAA